MSIDVFFHLLALFSILAYAIDSAFFIFRLDLGNVVEMCWCLWVVVFAFVSLFACVSLGRFKSEKV